MITTGVLIAVALGLAPASIESQVRADPQRVSPITTSVAVSAPELRPSLVPSDQMNARSRAVTSLYVSFAALQGLDVYSTRRALRGGAEEANPLLRTAVGNAAVMLTVKAMSSAVSIYMTERIRKSNRRAATALMVALNGVTAAVVARNLHHAQ